MEKAFERLAGGGSHGSGSGANAPSKGFQNLIRGIAEAKTKHVSVYQYTGSNAPTISNVHRSLILYNVIIVISLKS